MTHEQRQLGVRGKQLLPQLPALPALPGHKLHSQWIAFTSRWFGTSTAKQTGIQLHSHGNKRCSSGHHRPPASASSSRSSGGCKGHMSLQCPTPNELLTVWPEDRHTYPPNPLNCVSRAKGEWKCAFLYYWVGSNSCLDSKNQAPHVLQLLEVLLFLSLWEISLWWLENKTISSHTR